MIKLILPKGRIEWILFISFLIFYFILSLQIVFNTSLIDNYHYPTDIYFSYDNVCYYYRGYQAFTPHPLILAFTKPIVVAGDLISSITGIDKSKTFFIAFCMNIMSCLSIIYIYKYLNKIIGLKNYITIILVVMYGIFATSLMQSFTFESFTLSTLTITFTLLYFSLKNKNCEKIPMYACIILPIIVGGITITNLAIALLPIILSNGKKINIFIKVLIPCLLLSVLMIYVENKYHFTSDVASRMEYFRPKDFSYIDKVTLFLGSPFLMSSISVVPKIFNGEKINDMIMFLDYQSLWQYIIIYGTLILALVPCFKAYKNKNIIVLVFILLYNILIHVVVRYGLDEPFIYGGHWIYIIPILLGFTYSITKKRSTKYVIGATFSIILVILLVNNSSNFIDFINISKVLYPPF